VPGNLAMAVRRPVGVVVGVAPWNAPVILADARGRDAARLRQHGRAQGVRALPAHARRAGAAIADAGLPAAPSTWSSTRAGDAPDVMDELIAHPAVRRVSFTGSSRSGASSRSSARST
jgi:benzaldehyde dehydrogenase (NAD)